MGSVFAFYFSPASIISKIMEEVQELQPYIIAKRRKIFILLLTEI